MKLGEKIKRISKPIYVVLIVATIAACGNSKMDRKDKVAAIVGTLNDPFIGATFTPQVLIDKSGINKGALPFTYQAFASFFMSEDKTGIDNDEQVQVVVENSGGMLPNAYVFVPLESAKTFRVLVEKELGAKVQEKNGVQYFRKDKDNYVVAWKDDLAIISNIPFSLDNLFSKGTTESKKAAIRLVSLLNEVSSKNIHGEFRAFFDKVGDFRMFANGESAYSVIDGMRFVSKRDKKEIKSLIDGTTFETALNFEKGSIDFDGNYALADSLKSYFDLMKSASISPNMLKYGLSDDPVMALSMNLSVPNLVRIMNKQRDALDADDLERELAKMNIKLDDLPDLFGGEMLFMINNVESKERTYTDYNGMERTYNTEEPIFLTVLSLEDPDRVEALISSSLPEDSEENKLDDGAFYLIKDGKLFITNSNGWLSAIQNGKTVVVEKVGDKLSKTALGLYVSSDMSQKYASDLRDLNGLEEKMSDLIVEVNNAGAKLSIKLKDADKNALQVILEQMVEAYEQQEKGNNAKIEDILNDELLENIGKEVEEGIEEAINSEELQELIESF